jgi:poly-gamma-glutamate capsule biosynthesis protein CapA/YwtB (metallophosphatase superfamily)
MVSGRIPRSRKGFTFATLGQSVPLARSEVMNQAATKRAGDRAVTLFLCGDVMLGRGVDQVLPHPGEPTLRERSVKDARTYIDLAARVNGSIPRPVDWSWPWGDALELLASAHCDARILNLETSITTSSDFARGKGVHYRMHPANVAAVEIVQPDVCVLANNHVLDFGRRGLLETLEALAASRLRWAGAGRSLSEAAVPAFVPVPRSGGRVVVLAFGTPSSGIPHGWAAAADRPGVHLLPSLTDAAADELCRRAEEVRQPNDIVVVSAHWGTNWGYDVDADHIRFAHRLIDGGVDVVHGHSSHHPRPIELYSGKLILYGCGDLVDDYEGITGHEQYRDDLRLLYLPRLDPASGQLKELRLAPLQARQLRLHRASEDDAEWLRAVLNGISRSFGSRIERDAGGFLTVAAAR